MKGMKLLTDWNLTASSLASDMTTPESALNDEASVDIRHMGKSNFVQSVYRNYINRRYLI